MKINFSVYDLKYYLKKNQKIYLSFLFFFFLGIIFGILIAASSDSYMSLLSSGDKTLFDYINGSASFSKQTTRLILRNIVFLVIIFVCNLNFYTGLLCYLLVSYQSALLMLLICAIISLNGLAGIIVSIFCILPLNLVLFVNSIVFAEVCLSRSLSAKNNKLFSFGFDEKTFWLKVLFLLLFVIVFSCLINLLYMIVLRNRIFIIF